VVCYVAWKQITTLNNKDIPERETHQFQYKEFHAAMFGTFVFL